VHGDGHTADSVTHLERHRVVRGGKRLRITPYHR
jgi:hypothetical protein